jgi:hypothetical protein
MVIDWVNLTAAQARRLIAPAARHEQAMAKRWDAGEVSEAAWMDALHAEENLRVFAVCGLKPGQH